MLKVSFQWKNSDKICLCSHWAAGEILPPFCVYARRVAAFTEMAKSSEKALVKRFCEKNFTEFLARVEKWSAFLSSAISWKRFLRRKTQNAQQFLAVLVVNTGSLSRNFVVFLTKFRLYTLIFSIYDVYLF